jgi:hypothetical protein
MTRDVRPRESGGIMVGWKLGRRISVSLCSPYRDPSAPPGHPFDLGRVHSHPGQATLPTSRKHPFASIACAATSAATAPAATRTSDRIGDGAEDGDAPAAALPPSDELGNGVEDDVLALLADPPISQWALGLQRRRPGEAFHPPTLRGSESMRSLIVVCESVPPSVRYSRCTKLSAQSG